MKCTMWKPDKEEKQSTRNLFPNRKTMMISLDQIFLILSQNKSILSLQTKIIQSKKIKNIKAKNLNKIKKSLKHQAIHNKFKTKKKSSTIKICKMAKNKSNNMSLKNKRSIMKCRLTIKKRIKRLWIYY
jgi:hypothetical protein